MDKAPDAFRTISEVAEELAVPQHVLRFWETRFAQIKPMKRGGGRRYYRPDDVDLLRGIRHLLYGEGYTIRGVQRILRENGPRFVQSVWQENAPQPERRAGEEEDSGRRAERRAREEEEGGERGRGLLLGILPSLFGRDHQQGADAAEDEEDERREPVFEPELDRQPGGEDDGEDAEDEEDREEEADRPPAGPARARAKALARNEEEDSEDIAHALVPGKLPSAEREKLQAALDELSECRRLLDAALQDVA